ncbi:MAG: hypothetical protein ACLTCV_04910 [Oscillospiraceae bacterium]
MVYEWDLVRTTGTKTEKDKPMQTVNCPNCGAPVEINASAKRPWPAAVCHHPREHRLRPQRPIRAPSLSKNERTTRPGKRISTKNSTAQARAVEFF